MKRFRFTLEKVLEYRARLLDQEQARLSERIAALRRVDEAIELLERSRREEEARVRAGRTIEALELGTLAAFLRGAAVRERALKLSRAEAERAVAEQRERVLAARREHRLIERLRERRLAEWRIELDKELQQTAEENFLARWTAEA